MAAAIVRIQTSTPRVAVLQRKLATQSEVGAEEEKFMKLQSMTLAALVGVAGLLLAPAALRKPP